MKNNYELPDDLWLALAELPPETWEIIRLRLRAMPAPEHRVTVDLPTDYGSPVPRPRR